MQSKFRAFLTSRNNLKNIGGFAAGAMAGFIYYRTVGCSSGSCAITSNPYLSMVWGGMLGYLLADIFKIKGKKQQPDNPDETER